jgi:hypothetical protein
MSIRRNAALAIAVLASAATIGLNIGWAQATSREPTDTDLAITSLAADRGISTAEAAIRISWQDKAPALADQLRTLLGAQYGGLWIDPANGDRIKVGIAGSHTNTASIRNAAASHGLAGAVDTVQVSTSISTLESINETLANTLDRVNQDAAWPLSAGLRPDINAVELDAPPAAQLTITQQSLVNATAARFGAAIRIVTVQTKPQARSCRYPYCDPALRGGIRINNSGFGCTGAFIARSRIDGKFYQFTAGHCAAAASDNWSTHFADGSTHIIGPVHNHVFSGSGDMAILTVNNPSGWNPQPWVFVTASADTTRNESYSINADSGSTVGMRICTTGGFLGHSDCGTVTQLGVTATYEGVTVHDLGRGTFCGTAGDSGAPMYASHTAYGLQVAGFSACDSLYQGIRAAENALNVNVAHN